MAELLYLHRGRFQALPGAEARQTGSNVWVVSVPKSDAVQRMLRGQLTASRFDDSLWEIDGVESIQALGSGETPDALEITVLLP